jgi:arylformamidase
MLGTVIGPMTVPQKGGRGVSDPAAEYRAELDFEITFSNGGSLRGAGFRIDIADPGLTEPGLGEALVRDLGLLMADRVEIRGYRIIAERHKRAVPAVPAGDPAASGGEPAPAGREGEARPAGRDLRRADLSHPIEDGMITVPGLPPPQIRADSVSAALPPGRYAPGVEFAIGEIRLCGNTGTYLDSPFHRYPDGGDLAALPLGRLADLDGVVVDVTGSAARAVGRAHFLPYQVRDKAVLVRTGWDRHWETGAYAGDHPFLTAEAAAYLAGAGVLLVGIDAINIDDTADPERPAHSLLLAAGIPVCEHLAGLGALPATGFRFSAVPPRVAGFGTFPVRAYATWPVGRP